MKRETSWKDTLCDDELEALPMTVDRMNPQIAKRPASTELPTRYQSRAVSVCKSETNSPYSPLPSGASWTDGRGHKGIRKQAEP